MPKIQLIFLTTFYFLSIPFGSAQEDGSWETVAAHDELRQLISGRALDGKYWKFYFRADGVMAYSRNDFPSVRGWRITEDARLCYFVHRMPERIIDCHSIQRTTTQPTRYRFKSETEEFPIEFSEPSQKMIDAVTDRAGPE